MSVNKRRHFDKWVLPKNNNDSNRHKIYVAFVINFYSKNKRWPTDKEYKDGIVQFLVDTKQNKKNKKTAENHQLFQPIFYDLLKFESNFVKPTKVGLALMLDDNGIYFTELTFESFWNATFASGATGSMKKYDKINPIRIMMRHLVIKKKLTFEQLAYGFWGTEDQTGYEKISLSKKHCAQWEYIIKFLIDAKLIVLHGLKSSIRPGSHSKPNKLYDPNGYIKPTIKLNNLISDKEAGNSNIKKILAKFEIPFDKININQIIKNSKTINKNISTQRDSATQAAWKTILMIENDRCFICGIKEKIVLIASHIKPYSKCNLEEQFDLNNGLILCSNHDQLFDKGYLTFINKKIKFSDNLNILNWDRSINNDILDREFNLSKEKENYMKYHNNNVFKK